MGTSCVKLGHERHKANLQSFVDWERPVVLQPWCVGLRTTCLPGIPPPHPYQASKREKLEGEFMERTVLSYVVALGDMALGDEAVGLTIRVFVLTSWNIQGQTGDFGH